LVKNFIIAAAQMCSGMYPEQNLKEITRLAREASSKGVDYLLTPEMSVAFGENFEQLAKVAQPYSNNDALEKCAIIARENKLFLHIGSLAVVAEETEQDTQTPEKQTRFVNRSVLFDPKGQIVDFYDKIHLFDADLSGDAPYRESKHYCGGKRAVISGVGPLKLGMSICYDLRFGALYRQLAQQGAQIISVPAAFTTSTGEAHWETLLRARAIETGCYIIASAQGGNHENGRTTYGYSMIIDPWGKVVSQRKGDRGGLIVASVDREKIGQARLAVPALKNNAQFSLSINHDLSII